MSASITDTTASSLPARLARLRGTAAAAPLGARGIEQSARTARCVRRQAITLAGLPPARVAERVGARERDQQSPFAIASGNLFEHAVGMSGAHQLLALYRAAGRLQPEECRVVDIHALPPSLRRAETLRLVGQKLDERTTAPHLILQPYLTVRIAGRDEAIRPDLLVASDADACYSVGDIKSFADLDGRTNAASIRGAVRQVAVGVLALRAAVASLGAAEPERLVSAHAEVVLRRRGTGRPSLRVIEQVDEVDIIARHIARAPALLAAVEAALPPGATLDDPDVVMALPYRYDADCHEACPLAEACRRQAAAAGDPIIVGATGRRALAAAESSTRALALLDDAAAHGSADEDELAARLRAAERMLGEALHG